LQPKFRQTTDHNFELSKTSHIAILDPTTALSLAGNILQFVDFSRTVLQDAFQLYNSSKSTTTVREELKMVVGDLFKLTAKLRVPENKGDVKDSNSTAESENELEALCASCVEIGKELITHLEAPALYSDRLIMGVEATRIITRGWGSLWAAVQFAFTSDEMEALKRRLSAIREAIELRIFVELSSVYNVLCSQRRLMTFGRDKIDANALRTSSRFDNLDMKTQQVSTTILDCRFSLEDDIRDQTRAIAQMLCRTELAVLAQNDKTRAIVLDVLRQSRENGGQSGSSPLSGGEEEQLSKFKQEEVDLKAKVEGIILDALSFATMTDRLKEVPEPHARTCRWIFENPTALTRPWTSFNEWLQGDEGLYWINGKAASGKSTLLRYIYLSPRTRELLTSWAMPFELQTASFFFWNSGTLEQRSQTGFLRALLFELLQSQQDLISTALPLQWARVYSQLLSYSNQKPFVELDLDELMQALQILAEQTVVKVKLFLLIDGLDEYEGNFEKIGELLCKLAKSSNIKICVSSRPLLVLEDAFDGYPSLRLQDLTYQDITNHMSDELGNYPRFRSLASKEPLRAPELIREVVTKANGVFLWVYLVVQSLISGLANRDTIADLQRRLRDLPPKLEDLYSHMLDRIDRFYISKASEMFQLVRAQREISFLHGPGRRLKYPFTIFALAMADQDNVLETTNKQPGYWSTTEIIESCSDMEDRLKVRSAGLLEVQRPEETENSAQSETLDWQAKVLYIHRTARDYIESPEVWNNLLKHTSETNFDAYYSLFRSGVLQTRLLAAHTEMVTFNTLGHIALQTMGYSSTIQWKDSTLMCNLLDKLDECHTTTT
jgi:hypothetical protein